MGDARDATLFSIRCIFPLLLVYNGITLKFSGTNKFDTQNIFLRRRFENWKWRNHLINYVHYCPKHPSEAEELNPILFVHGFGASIAHYRNNIDFFVNAGYPVYAVDLIGFGKSHKPTKDFTFSIESLSELVADFIEEKSPNMNTKWIICGNSLGGLITLYITSLLKRRIFASIVLNSSSSLTIQRPDELPILLRPIWWIFVNIIMGDIIGPIMFQMIRLRQTLVLLLRFVYKREKVGSGLRTRVRSSYCEDILIIFDNFDINFPMVGHGD